MKEIAYWKMADGGTLALEKHGDKYEVACYNKSDIEEWRETFDNEDAAWSLYVRKKYVTGVA
jgi:ribosome maturation protein Sdo1